MDLLHDPLAASIHPTERIRARPPIAVEPRRRAVHRRVRLRLQPGHVPVLADPCLRVVVIFERVERRGASTCFERRRAVPRIGVDNAGLHGGREGVVSDDPTAAAAVGGSRRRRGRISEEGGKAVWRVGRIVEIEALLPERGLRPGHEFVHDAVDVRPPSSPRRRWRWWHVVLQARRYFIRDVPPRRGIRAGLLSMSLD